MSALEDKPKQLLEESKEFDLSKSKEISKNCTLNILNQPAMIAFAASFDDKDDPRFRYLPFNFKIQDLIEEVLDPAIGDVEYEITSIISYNVEDEFFEKIFREENDNWEGFADGQRFEINHAQMLNILFVPSEKHPNLLVNSWAIIQNPVLLVFRKKREDSLLKGIKNRRKYAEEEVEIVFDTKEDQQRYEEDLQIARQLQESLNKEYDKNILHRVPQIDGDLDEDEWNCGHCTVKNSLPNYR